MTTPTDRQTAAWRIAHVFTERGRPTYDEMAEAALTAAEAATIERCACVALEQRCERNTPWDRACVAIATAIRALKDKP